MKRVRIVALGAAALGVAVAAGSQFQSMQEGMPPAPAEQTAALAPQGDQAGERPTLVQAGAIPATIPGAVDLTQGSAPVALASANALPGSSMPSPASVEISIEGMPAGVSLSDEDLNRLMTGEMSEEEFMLLLQAQGASASPITGAAVLNPPTGINPLDPGASPVPGILQGLARSDASAPPFAPTGTITAQADATMPLDSTLEAELNACAVWLVVTPAPGAMLDASVYAPCDRNAMVQISHAGLTFDAQLGDDGQLLSQIPALSVEGMVEMRFEDGRVTSDQSRVPDLADIDRVALQWNAPISVALHAYEFGAQYGEAGHIHAGNPQAPGAQGRGFLTILGSADRPGAQMAQVYSYPRGQSPRTGQVTLEIEVPVTVASCGQTLQAHAFELFGGNSGQVRAINVEMPACDNAGGYVVLPGVLPDLQIALN